MQWYESILEYRHGRYLKVAALLCAAAVSAYVLDTPPAGLNRYGGTRLGYGLGIVAAALILWLMWLGVRKRSYRSTFGTVQGWTSSHVYLGLSLLVLASLHCGFEFGWNVHTLAYALMVAVILSGALGVYAYLRYPALMTRNLAGEELEEILARIAELDGKCAQLALDLPDEVSTPVARASRGAARDVGAPARPRWRFPGAALMCPTRAACRTISRIGANYSGEQAVLNQRLLGELTRKAVLIDRVRTHLHLRALLEAWLFVHVPLSFGLLAALIAHVISVFFFW